MMGNTNDFACLWHSHKPTIAKVHGYAVAGGSDIALSCDLVVMADSAKIGYPPARVWGIPTTGVRCACGQETENCTAQRCGRCALASSKQSACSSRAKSSTARLTVIISVDLLLFTCTYLYFPLFTLLSVP
jgi:hypothetical protein